jgi:hypothetical protein
MDLSSEASQTAVKILKCISPVLEDRKVFAAALEGLACLFECESGSVFTYLRAKDELHKVKSLKAGEVWDMDTVMSFYRNEKPLLGSDTIMAPVRSGSSVIGVVALRRHGGFAEGAGKTATEVLKMVGSVLAGRRDLAVSEAEASIAAAALAGVNPKDVIYRTLHQLRRFIDYSHGATVIQRFDDSTGLAVARQVAWTKGKSSIIGMRVPVSWQDLPPGFVDSVTRSCHISIWMSLSQVEEPDSPPKGSMLVASLAAGGGVIGCVEIASSHTNFFLDNDSVILSRFLPYLSWCLMHIQTQPGGRDE